MFFVFRKNFEATTRTTSQNLGNIQGNKYLRRSSALAKLLFLQFTVILLKILKLFWTFIMILWSFTWDPGLLWINIVYTLF